jgi:ring-1,2-phenylacetyl-CoA epoxidase subunit PaaE
MSAVPQSLAAGADPRPVHRPPAPRFHTLTVAGVERLTLDAIAVRFAVPRELREDYRFIQGQFVTLKANFGAGGAREELRRSYSICCAVADYLRNGELKVGIKAVPGGRFSGWANTQLKPGDAVEVMTPDGRFHCALDEGQARHYVALAGGSGITPVLSLISTTLAAEPRSRYTLVYGNRNLASIMFAEQLEELKNRYLGRLALYHVLSDEPQEVALFNGLLDRGKCAQFLDTLVPAAGIDEAFICGPGPMMDAAEAALIAAGVAREKIHIERFGTPLPHAGEKPAPAMGDGPACVTAGTGPAAAPAAQVDVISGGKTRRIAVPYAGAGLLDTALAAGIDLPYACKAGVCCTCRARVLEGEVKMDRNYTLEPREIAQGFVLTCQSHPVTARVVVSYDER